MVKVGKLTLDRNPDNFFAETEQVAFHTGHVVPGIDFTNDPLLQGRLFSYIDTQLRRVGPNFHELPINRSPRQADNNQRDELRPHDNQQGQRSHTSPTASAAAAPCTSRPRREPFPDHASPQNHRAQRHGSRSWKAVRDHFSQATMFWNSMSDKGPQPRPSFQLTKSSPAPSRMANIPLNLRSACCHRSRKGQKTPGFLPSVTAP